MKPHLEGFYIGDEFKLLLFSGRVACGAVELAGQGQIEDGKRKKDLQRCIDGIFLND